MSAHTFQGRLSVLVKAVGTQVIATFGLDIQQVGAGFLVGDPSLFPELVLVGSVKRPDGVVGGRWIV
jgi:hypothetical protein